LFATFHTLAEHHNVYGLDYPGAVFLAVGGAPDALRNHAGMVVALAQAMQQVVPSSLTLQIGIHTGSVVGAVIQSAGRPRYALWGEAIEVADRLSVSASPGTTEVSPAASQYLP
jgi:class 3 adenylate cyclase